MVAIAVTWASAAPGAETEVDMSGISGDPDTPRRHFRLRHPARLAGERAEDTYGLVAGALAAGYARSGLTEAREYRSWRRFNTVPYLSATHGNHYVSHYANRKAWAYARYEEAGTFPQGAIVAKDSFSVTETGGILLGPLFLMEKMPRGFNPVSGDWRYTMVLPDGSIAGRTRGKDAQRVDYCVACHLAREDFDHLYFVPPELRPMVP
jgi:hypothetical protein